MRDSESQGWTRQDKERLIDAWRDAQHRGYPERFLTQAGVTRELILCWIEEQQRGELADDVRPLTDPHSGILELARSFRSIVTQSSPHLSVPRGSLAHSVVFDVDGQRRNDYLARSRSALQAVVDAAKREPTRVIRVRALSPAEAVNQVGAHWGVYATPSLVRIGRGMPEELEDAADGERSRSERRRMERWETHVATSDVAQGALVNWIETSPAARLRVGVVPARSPLGWQGGADSWPPARLREELLSLVRIRVGELARLRGDRWPGENDRLEAVLRRRIDILAHDYVIAGSDGAWRNSIAAYLQSDVVRLWRPSMEDFRSDSERADPDRGGTGLRASVAAIVEMQAYACLVAWTDEVTDSLVGEMEDYRNSEDPIARYLREPVVARSLLMTTSDGDERRADKDKADALVQHATRDAFDLHRRANLLRSAPGAALLDYYFERREAVSVGLAQMTHDDHVVVCFSDLIASLATANSKVRAHLAPASLVKLRRFLKTSISSSGLTEYAVFAERDEVIALQGIDHRVAVRAGRDALNRGDDHVTFGNDRERRRHMEARQQLAVATAGSAVQVLEDMLALDPREQTRFSPQEWRRQSNLALKYASIGLRAIIEMSGSGYLEGVRFESGRFADMTFLFRAHEIYYRCLCVAATADIAFSLNQGDQLGDGGYLGRLAEVFHGVTSLQIRPFTADDIGRILPSMLWHSFLAGDQMPALQYESNRELFAYDSIVRVLAPDEIGDTAAQTGWGRDRIWVLTQRLINMNKHVGPLGAVQEGSPVWKALEVSTGGLFGKWRSQFGDALHPRKGAQ